MADKFGLKPGDAMDLITGWNFDREDHRQQARELIQQRRPKLLIGSPDCTMFSQLQSLSGWNEHKASRWRQARRHLQFVCELYRDQVRRGDWFLHEHPIGASSWREQCVLDVMKENGVETIIGDQCMYGLVTMTGNGKQPARKRTRFMSNAPEILKRLSRRCLGEHQHQHLVSGRARGAAEYPDDLCRAICQGYIKQREHQHNHVRQLLTVTAE